MGDSNRPGIFHKKFMRKYQQELIALGIPLEGQTIPDWLYLLEHGDFYGYYWKVDDLSKDQAKRLLEIVEEYGYEYPGGLYGELKRKLSK